jgi:hypothetical protein
MDSETFTERLEGIDETIAELEERINEDADLDVAEVLPSAMDVVEELLRTYAAREGKELPEDGELLEVQKAFVKGEPSLNAVRDNVRELIYYHNCLEMDRRDALPEKSGRMAVRTARHLYLYLRSRAEQAGYLA